MSVLWINLVSIRHIRYKLLVVIYLINKTDLWNISKWFWCLNYGPTSLILKSIFMPRRDKKSFGDPIRSEVLQSYDIFASLKLALKDLREPNHLNEGTSTLFFKNSLLRSTFSSLKSLNVFKLPNLNLRVWKPKQSSSCRSKLSAAWLSLRSLLSSPLGATLPHKKSLFVFFGL